MNKLILIIDANESYLQKEVKLHYNEIKSDNNELKEITEWANGLGEAISLFGIKPIYHLKLRNNEDIKKFVEYLKKRAKDKWWGHGVIITSTTNVGLKKIKEAVESNNGLIIEKKEPEVIKQEILNRYNLNKETKSVVSYHVGNDYEMLLPLTNSLDKLTKKEQKELSVEEALILMLEQEGEVPPWKIINPLFNEDIKEALLMYNRIKEHSHPLVIMAIIKPKIEMLYQAGILYTLGNRTFNGIAQALELNKKNVLYTVFKMVRKTRYENLCKIAELTNEVESKLKGKSVEDDNQLILKYLVEIYALMNNERI